MATINDGDFTGHSTNEAAPYLALMYTEREKTRRVLIISAAFMAVAAMFLMSLSPNERVTISCITGATTIVFSMGAIGANKFLLTAGLIKVETPEANHNKEKAKDQHADGRVTLERVS